MPEECIFMYVLCGPQNKQRPFPKTVLNNRSLEWTHFVSWKVLIESQLYYLD